MLENAEDTVAGVEDRARVLPEGAQAAIRLLCALAGRHEVSNASPAQLAHLPQLRTTLLSGGIARYCPTCWTWFLPDGSLPEGA